MNVLRHTDANFGERLGKLASASSLFDPVIEQRARAILDEVGARGDAALLEFTERFDGAKFTSDQLAVTQAFIAALRAILGVVATTRSDGTWMLTHPPTG